MASARTFYNLTGLVLSIACVIHCMITPLVISSLPAWGLTWLAQPVFHQTLALAGIAIGTWTLLPGWKQHRRHAVLVFGVLGLMVMNYAAFFGDGCCGAGVHASSSDSAVCTLACCTAETDLSVETEANNKEPVLVSRFSATTGRETSAKEANSASSWTWLFQHQTAWGAALLAWAHCFNGACAKTCCQRWRERSSKEVTTCGNTNVVSATTLVQLSDSTAQQID